MNHSTPPHFFYLKVILMTYKNPLKITQDELYEIGDKRVQNTPLNDREDEIINEALSFLSETVG